MTFARHTLCSDASIEGRGLHSGVPVKVALHPASSGIRLIWGTEVVSATVANVTDTARCTRLGSISTVEHLLSALAGLHITDVDIELTAPELPADDGSAGGYVRVLREADQEKIGESEVTGPFARVFAHDQRAKVAISAGTGHWKYDFECGSRWPHSQTFETREVANDYPDHIAPARTFGFAEEIPAILEAGMAQGLDLQTALILGPTDYHNSPVFADEPARHKMLDLIGDLSLAGVPIDLLNVAAERSGHRVNVQAAALLAQTVQVRPA